MAARNKETCVSQERILEASDKLRAERSERNKRQQQKVDEDRHAEVRFSSTSFVCMRAGLKIPFDRWAAQTLINLANNTQRDSPEVD